MSDDEGWHIPPPVDDGFPDDLPESFEAVERQYEAKRERQTILDRLFDLHIELVNLCARDILTEDEHSAFEDLLEAVMERYNNTPGG